MQSSRKQMYGNTLQQNTFPMPEVRPAVELPVEPRPTFSERIRSGEIKVVPNQHFPEIEGIKSLNPFA